MKLFVVRWYESLIEWIEQRKEKRFLKSHGCTTRKQYERKYDTDIQQNADDAKTFYHGYPYVFMVVPDLAYKLLLSYGLNGVWPYHDLTDQMVEWCEKNCKDKWRNDWLHGYRCSDGFFNISSIANEDIMFFAFKDEGEYVWFKLTWG